MPRRGVGARPQRNSSFLNMAMAPLQRAFLLGRRGHQPVLRRKGCAADLTAPILLRLTSLLVAPRWGAVDRTYLFDGRARVVRHAPVLGLSARLEPSWLDVRTGHDEVALDVAQGERSHPPIRVWPLVLLCHKFWCPFRAAQHGQRESVVARAATNLRRIVAIEFERRWRFLPLIFLPASKPCGSIQGPLFQRSLTLWLSMMAAVGLASRLPRSRHST